MSPSSARSSFADTSTPWRFCSVRAGCWVRRWKAPSANRSAAPIARLPNFATSTGASPSGRSTFVPSSLSRSNPSRRQLQLHEWEYLHETKTDRGRRAIKVTTPLTWVIAYSSTYSLSMLRQVVAGHEERDSDAVRAFVLRACLMHLHFTKFPAIAELLAGLRYRVEVRHSPELGDLPLVTISPPFSTMRPADNLVTTASGLAGGASFAEVLDLETVRKLQDPLRQEIAATFRTHGQEHLALMKNRHRVVWTKGMFLTPQHFQTQDQYLENAVQFRFAASHYANWGVTDLSIDSEALGKRALPPE